MVVLLEHILIRICDGVVTAVGIDRDFSLLGVDSGAG
jgi:hypothetical protein